MSKKLICVALLLMLVSVSAFAENVPSKTTESFRLEATSGSVKAEEVPPDVAAQFQKSANEIIEQMSVSLTTTQEQAFESKGVDGSKVKFEESVSLGALKMTTTGASQMACEKPAGMQGKKVVVYAIVNGVPVPLRTIDNGDGTVSFVIDGEDAEIMNGEITGFYIAPIEE